MLCIAVALTACSGAPSRPPKSGGYYLDDGPGANPPADIERIPDPVPRLEPINFATTRPFTVLGKTYTPFTEIKPYRVRGRASWYGRRYHGQKTSSGETYDMYAMSAAHTLLPLPSYARVTNVENGRTVVVRVNDRGPFHDDRIIDLSYTAAYKLGFINSGSAIVEVEAIIPGQEAPPAPVVAAIDPPPAPVVAAIEAPPVQPPVESQSGGIYVQLGAFSIADNAEGFLRKMRIDLPWLAGSMSLYARDGLHKVHAGPYPNRDAAQRDAERVRQSLGFSPFVLSR